MDEQMATERAIEVLKTIKEDNYNYVITDTMEVAIKALENVKLVNDLLCEINKKFDKEFYRRTIKSTGEEVEYKTIMLSLPRTKINELKGLCI